MQWLVSSEALWFSVPAVAGTLYLVMQVVLGQIGGELDLDADAGGEGRVLSLQTLSAFAMGSGWIGLATLNLTDIGFNGSVVIAVLAGVAMAWLLVFLLRTMLKLQSSGNLSLTAAVGETGRVYVEIPPVGRGRGRITVVLQGRQAELSAVQQGAEPIASRTPVKVIDADEARNVLIVEPIA